MRRGLKSFHDVWRLAKPLILYYVGYYLAYMALGMLLAGNGLSVLFQDEEAVIGGICMLGGCLILFPMIGEEREILEKERKEREWAEAECRDAEDKTGNEERKIERNKTGIFSYIFLAVYAVCAVVFFNMLMGYLGMPEKSAAFQEAAKNQYAVSLGMGLLLYAGISAVVEETVFRFLLYNRLRRMSGKTVYGIVVSAFLFGIYHGNMVQGSYAFVMGILLAVSYVYFDSFFAPVLFHGLGNAVIFICNMIPEIYNVVFTPVNFVVFGIVTAAGGILFVKKQKYKI